MNKNFLASKNYDLKAIEKQQKHEENAWYIINSINKTKSNWLKGELVKNLYFYLDLSFVKDELIKIYKATDSKELKGIIKGLHDQTLDLSNLIEEAEENTRLFKENEEARKEFEEEIHTEDFEDSIIKVKDQTTLQSREIGLLKSSKL